MLTHLSIHHGNAKRVPHHTACICSRTHHKTDGRGSIRLPTLHLPGCYLPPGPHHRRVEMVDTVLKLIIKEQCANGRLSLCWNSYITSFFSNKAGAIHNQKDKLLNTIIYILAPFKSTILYSGYNQWLLPNAPKMQTFAYTCVLLYMRQPRYGTLIFCSSVLP